MIRRRVPIGRPLAAAMLIASLVLAPRATAALVGAAGSPESPTSYSGAASATGVQVELVVPGAPLTDQVVDTGGPTAQATADSLGAGQGYAAFPNPGPIIQVAPGLMSGLLTQGLAGLPPIPLPALPTYPASVTANGLTPDASAGAGPYSLDAHTKVGQARASASAGVQTSAIGNASLLASSASVQPTTDATVVSTATSDVQGLTVALLSVGEIKTTATATLDQSGAVTFTDRIEISALKVGGVGVSIDGATLKTPGPTIPLPLNSVLAQLLRSTGVTVKIAPAQHYPDRIVAPAVVITAPANVKIGTAPGTVSMTFGAVTAALSGAAPAAAATGANTTATGTPAVGDMSIGTPMASPPLDGSTGGGLGATPSAAPSVASAPADAGNGPVLATPSPTAFVGGFDMRSLDLELAGCALAIGLLSQLTRLLGVRRRWTSSGG